LIPLILPAQPPVAPASSSIIDCSDATALKGRTITALEYWTTAQKYFESAQFADAIRCLARFRPASNDRKDEAAYLHLRGASQLMLGKLGAAENDLERAIQLDDSIPGYYLDLILVCLKSANQSRAEAISTLAKRRFPNDIKLQVQIAALIHPVRAVSADWRLKGDGVIGCPCRTPCPCRSNSPPTGAHCEALGVMRIESGHWGKTTLKDVRFAVPGCMSDPFRFLPALYIDCSSDAEQEALTQILHDFNEQNPMSFVRTKRVPISFRKQGELLEAGSPGLFGLTVKLPASGSPAATPIAALDYFANTILYAKNIAYWFHDPELGVAASWDFSGRQANYRTISISSEDYRQKRMLIQWADESGGFNVHQLKLIHDLHLTVAKTP